MAAGADARTNRAADEIAERCHVITGRTFEVRPAELINVSTSCRSV